MSIRHIFQFFNKHALLFILLLFIIAGTYKLDEIPADWFGDISIVNNYVGAILAGQWPTNFSTSGGPLYMYLVSPFIAFFGATFLNYKLLSLAVSFFGLIAVYLCSKEIASRRIALLTTFLTGISFWFLVWARMGNYNILTPIITALMVYFFVRYIKTYHLKWLALSIFTSCLGLFTYAGTFLLPFVLLAMLLWEMFIRQKTFDRKKLAMITLFYLPGFLLFALLIFLNWESFINGYMGVKLTNAQSLTLQESIFRVLRNAFRTLTMLHIEGDIVFRWNIEKAPLIDFVSGIFFLVGILFFIKREKKYKPYVLLPLFLLPLPSILPGHPPVEIPNSPRTMAIIPIVFLFIAYGIDYSGRVISKRFGRNWGIGAVAAFLVVITILNCYNYFIRYPQQLPNRNLSFGKIIAAYIDTKPADIPVYVASLGWGEWGQPSSDSIKYSLKNKNRTITYAAPDCNFLWVGNNFIIILDPLDDVKKNLYMKCFPTAKVEVHTEENQKIFTTITKTR